MRTLIRAVIIATLASVTLAPLAAPSFADSRDSGDGRGKGDQGQDSGGTGKGGGNGN